jgi:hypothetical protein
MKNKIKQTVFYKGKVYWLTYNCDCNSIIIKTENGKHVCSETSSRISGGLENKDFLLLLEKYVSQLIDEYLQSIENRETLEDWNGVIRKTVEESH